MVWCWFSPFFSLFSLYSPAARRGRGCALCQVEQQEVLRKEKELIALVHRPAEAERFKVH